ncbi:hypothetical protein [Lacihabitans lacunae]|uniref:Uncharacterized protein n=1 Tax=Lacihabitans lacunae TaxID=1028214 RepID=A0ABV7YW58_9BACT
MLLKGLKKLIEKSADKPAKLKLKLELTKAYRFENIKLALQEGNQTLVLAKTQKNVALELQPAFEPPKTKMVILKKSYKQATKKSGIAEK